MSKVIDINSSSSVPKKRDRKTIERNRRIEMKSLCFKLTSLVPPHHFAPSKELLSQQDQLDQVATYIKGLKDRIDKLKVKKEVALMSLNGNSSGTSNNNTREEGSLRIPVVEVRELGSSLEVVFISELKKTFKLNQVISVLHEEGTQVMSATISTVGNRVFHTLHAQVKNTRVGVDTSSISERLQELMQSTSFLSR